MLILSLLLLLLLSVLVTNSQFNTTNSTSEVERKINLECGGIFNEQQFIVESPNYPGNYPAMSDCAFVFGGQQCRTEFRLQFVDFSLENSLGCSKDRLEVADKDALCGNAISGTTRSYSAENGVLQLRFTSDSSTTERGFRILVSKLPCEDRFPITPVLTDKSGYIPNCCQPSYHQKHFFLTSPNFPHGTSNTKPPPGPSEECLYKIYKTNGNVCRLRIHFLFFWSGDYDEYRGCTNGFLQVDGKKICGCRIGLKLIVPFSPNGRETFKTLRFVNPGQQQTSFSGFVLEVVQDECPKRINNTSGIENGFHYYNDQKNKVAFPTISSAITLSETSEVLHDVLTNNNKNVVKHVYVFADPDEATASIPKDVEVQDLPKPKLEDPQEHGAEEPRKIGTEHNKEASPAGYYYPSPGQQPCSYPNPGVYRPTTYYPYFPNMVPNWQQFPSNRRHFSAPGLVPIIPGSYVPNLVPGWQQFPNQNPSNGRGFPNNYPPNLAPPGWQGPAAQNPNNDKRPSGLAPNFPNSVPDVSRQNPSNGGQPFPGGLAPNLPRGFAPTFPDNYPPNILPPGWQQPSSHQIPSNGKHPFILPGGLVPNSPGEFAPSLPGEIAPNMPGGIVPNIPGGIAPNMPGGIGPTFPANYPPGGQDEEGNFSGNWDRDVEETEYYDTSVLKEFLPDGRDNFKCRAWGAAQWAMLVKEVFWNQIPQCGTSSEVSHKCVELPYVKGYFYSSGYPLYYPPNSNSCFRIIKQDGYCSARLRMVDFDLEASPDCSKDYFQSGSGHRYCGNSLHMAEGWIDLGGKKFEEMRFRSDGRDCGRGFKAVYEQIACGGSGGQPPHFPTPPTPPCGRTIRERLFTLQVDGYKGDTCGFRVAKWRSDVCTLELKLLSFNLPCNLGYMLVEAKKFCGNLSGQKLYVNFDYETLPITFYKFSNNAPNSGTKIELKQLLEGCLTAPPAERVLVPTTNRNKTLTDLPPKLNDTKPAIVNTTASFDHTEICGFVLNATRTNLTESICNVLLDGKRNQECLPIKENVIYVPYNAENVELILREDEAVEDVIIREISCQDAERP